ncbi:MAG: DGQHR domain-containing protein [Rhodopseudomonas sp.]|uniref:DGQHR domain-containing protein n=1 Tax=Rhodopseudomonas sp. TaxID=1078 RepID=UPI0017F6CA46|nr:DGQHR domain-containing protein [Rhodopseudomonas sp.]NVN87872.1 DGQHR domain-containing protein [Rhodopseudomonas sp.]
MFSTIEAQKEDFAMARMMPPLDRVRAVIDSIPVVEGQKLRSGVPVVAGYIAAGLLIPDNYDIPTFDPRNNRGYQRPLQDSRVNELAADLKKKRVDLPTAILLNLRNREARQAVQDGKLRLGFLRDSASTAILFHVVDGQHRVAALKKLMEDDPDGDWDKFLIPFICMVGATEQEEMEQFYVVNSRAKSVRTDLALALLRKLTDKDSKMLERLEEKGKGWQVAAEKLVEALAENSSVWRGLIRLAATEKGATTMPSASMVTSLKPLLASPFFGRLNFAQQQQVIEAFWTGLRDVMRPAFDEPPGFVIQKGVGVIVMHAILVDVLEIARSTGRSVIDAATYSDVMAEPMKLLQGEAQDGQGTPVHGVEFWRTAPQGAAGSYSSSAGRRVLISKIRQMLPKVEVV